MTSLFKKKPAVVAKTARKVRLTPSEVQLAINNGIPLVDMAKAKAPKRGRPVGSKNKAKQKPAAKVKTFKQSTTDAAVHRLMDANLSLIKDNNQLLKLIENLEHQIIGFRAVISYLENQTGLRNTQ
jgi:predicted transcriptional regulator